MEEAVGLVIAFLVGFVIWLLVGEGLLVPWLAHVTGEADDGAEGPTSGAAA